MKGTKLTSRRGRETKTKNIEKWKVLKERPVYLQKPQKKNLGVEEDEDKDDDWFVYPKTIGNNTEQAWKAKEVNNGQGVVEQLDTEEEKEEQLQARPVRNKKNKTD